MRNKEYSHSALPVLVVVGFFALHGFGQAPGTILTVAGTGSPGYNGDNQPATTALLNQPPFVAVDHSGNIYIADEKNNRIRKVDTTGTISTFAGTGVPGFGGDTGSAVNAMLNAPNGVFPDTFGNVYINDPGNQRIRKVDATGHITTVAGTGTPGYNGDGIPATSANFFNAVRTVVDAAGNLYIADQSNHRVRKVGTNGIVTTIVGTGVPGFNGDGAGATTQLNNPTAVALDAAGNVYLSDQLNHRIREWTGGQVVTIAGTGIPGFNGDGAPLATELNFPGGLIVDPSGAILFTDGPNYRLRKISADRTQLTTIAGNGIPAFNGDGIPATVAEINSAFGVSLDLNGNIYLADTLNNRIRKIVATPPANCTYSLSSGGQAFPPTGGPGAINIVTQQGCPWNVTGLPVWVTLTSPSSSAGTGTATFLVLPNAGGDLTATLTIAGQNFVLEQQAASIGGLSFIGSMPHVAAEGGWSTTFTFVNKGMAAAVARTSLFAPGGAPLALPLNLPQQPAISGTLVAASLDQPINPNASFVMQAVGPANVQYLEGSAQLAANGNLDGFAIFHFDPNNQEAVVPMETRTAASYLLGFDNTNGVLTGVALANVSASTANIPVTIRDDTGTLVTTGSIPLAGSGHTSFVLSAQYPSTANIRGTIEFDTPLGGRISALGIRYTPGPVGGTTTTIPAFASGDIPGGLMAHLAVGNGWETTFVLVNTGGAVAQAHLKFFDKLGNPMPLPLSFPQAGGGPSTTSATLDRTIAAGASLWVQATLPAGAAYLEGSAQLTTDGNIGGFEIFRYDPNGQEAVVPLENRNAPSYLIAYDNTGGIVTGIAISGVSSNTVLVPVTLRDDTGAVLGTGTIPLGSNGHISFAPLATRFPQTAGLRGTIEFDAPPGAQISVLGIRTPPALTFTTLPALAK